MSVTSPPPNLFLRGRDDRQQVLISARFSNGSTADYTRKVIYQTVPQGILTIDRAGILSPISDGKASVTVKSPEGLSLTFPVTVEAAQIPNPINFANQIVPILTKAGCNSGGCHGKASGQNGFRLSLLGFEPAEDYEHLVKETRGRRLFPGSPDHSLLLLKATATLPHGGGQKLERDSPDYQMLVRWISQGMPYGKTNDPTVARIEVFPRERTLNFGAEQQLIVTAHYTDGGKQDVTRSALFEPNNKEMAKADNHGLVEVFEQPGDVAIMVRYQARVAVFQATIPLGAAVSNLPPVKNFIDELVFKKLKTLGMPPSELTDDSSFIRRATIDIAGRLPSPEETGEFLADEDRNKRDRLIERLVDSPGYAEYFANKWSALLRNKRGAPTHTAGNYAFYSWIRDSLYDNKPFDQFAAEILTASGEIQQNPPVTWYRQVTTPNAQLEDSAQLFLGLRLQCAQCHHHPYEKWSQEDYYSFAAFFSQVGRKPGANPGEEMIFQKRVPPSATNKKNQKPVPPAGLGGAPLTLSADEDARNALAAWMTQKDNPFFARALVNRYWKHFFSRGLVEPEDDLRETNPPTNAGLLDALAADFIKSEFDLKHLVRTICQSQTYQLSAYPNQFNGVDKSNFSRYYPKRLTAEVLFDALNMLTKSESRFDGLPPGTKAVQLPDNSFNASSYFLTVFGRPDSASSCECERSQDASLAQSLHLLNSKDVQEKLAHDQGRAAILAKDSRSDEAKTAELYALAFSRAPRPEEISMAMKYLEGKEKRRGYEDILWALINTKEFMFNY